MCKYQVNCRIKKRSDEERERNSDESEPTSWKQEYSLTILTGSCASGPFMSNLACPKCINFIIYRQACGVIKWQVSITCLESDISAIFIHLKTNLDSVLCSWNFARFKT